VFTPENLRRTYGGRMHVITSVAQNGAGDAGEQPTAVPVDVGLNGQRAR
jgi:hypothetical protein